MHASLQLRATLLSVLLGVALLVVWHIATRSSAPGAAPSAGMTAEQVEYAKLMGKDLGANKNDGFPTLSQMGRTIWGHLANPFYDNGPNDKGIAI